MSETSTTPNLPTELFSDAATQSVTIEKAELPTAPVTESPRFPVRVRDSEQPILLRLDTRLLAEQRTIMEANESILRRSQS
jgi:hypothetical protein